MGAQSRAGSRNAGTFVQRTNWLGKTERWYTAEEVARHCVPGDLWHVVHGKVYDVSSWLERHPGGAAALLKRAGQDASLDFDFHSVHARRQWAALQIGRLETGPGWLDVLFG